MNIKLSTILFFGLILQVSLLNGQNEKEKCFLPLMIKGIESLSAKEYSTAKVYFNLAKECKDISKGGIGNIRFKIKLNDQLWGNTLTKEKKGCHLPFILDGMLYLSKGDYPTANEYFYLAKECWDISEGGIEDIEFNKELNYYLWRDTLKKEKELSDSLRTKAEVEEEKAVLQTEKANTANLQNLKSLTSLTSYVLTDSSETFRKNGDWSNSVDIAFQAIKIIRDFNKDTLMQPQYVKYNMPSIEMPIAQITNFGNAIFSKEVRKQQLNCKKEIDVFKKDKSGYYYMAICRDSQSLRNDKILIWNDKNLILDSFSFDKDHIISASFSDSGKEIFICTKSGLGLLKKIGGDAIRFRGHTDALIQGVFYSEDSKVLTISRDGFVIKWDRQGNLISKQNLGKPLLSIFLDHSETEAFIRSANHLSGLDLRQDNSKTLSILDAENYISSFEFSTNQTYIASTEFYKNRVLLTNLQTGETNPINEVVALAFNPLDSVAEMMVSTINKEVCTISYANSFATKSLIQFSELIEKVKYSPNGKIALALDKGAGFILVSELKKVVHKNKARSAVFSSDSKFLLTCSQNGKAQLWSLGVLKSKDLIYSNFGDLLMEMGLEEPIKQIFFSINNDQVIGITQKGTLFTVPMPNLELDKMN